MLENEFSEASDHHQSSSSTDGMNDNETFEDDGNKLFEKTCISILGELIDDAMWDLCFEVHRAAKLGYFFLDDPDEKCQLVDDTEKDIFGQSSKALKSKVPTYQIYCSLCKKSSCATKYATHLAKCLGISGRNSSREASKKIQQAATDFDDNDSCSSFSLGRKKSKRNQAKKNSQKKPKIQGKTKSSETNANYQEMTYEERKAFFNHKCGVISKKTNKMCMNPPKCSQHSDTERADVRQNLLRDMDDQLTNDGQIDVDTVDARNCSYSFMSQSSSTSASN